MGRREKILGENVPSLVNLLKKAYCDEMRCCIDDYTIAKIRTKIKKCEPLSYNLDFY